MCCGTRCESNTNDDRNMTEFRSTGNKDRCQGHHGRYKHV